MKKTSSRILFFGNERLATGVTTDAPVLHSLLKAGYDVAAVVVAQKTAGPSRKEASQPEVAELAARHGIPVLAPTAFDAATVAELAAFKAPAAVLAAYGKMVPQRVIDLFPHGIINIHPSLLPKHRGPTPIESVILAGEPETGVSLMRLAAKMDAGPVYARKDMYLGSGHMTKQLLADSLAFIGAELLIKHLPDILDGSLTPAAQDDAAATYDQLIRKQDGLMDWQKSAAELERQFRAYAGWPRSRARIGTIDVIITALTLLDSVGTPGGVSTDGRKLIVFCKWGALQINRLVPDGKKEMTAEDFLIGYGSRL